jgi:lipase chaperone LimK
MKTDLYNINRKSIEPNKPLSPSERIKLIKNLAKNKFLKQQDIKKTLDSMIVHDDQSEQVFEKER